MEAIRLKLQPRADRRFWQSIVKDRSGLALTEFAFAAPILITMLAGGVELSNYAMVQTSITQVGLQLASNGARVGEDPDRDKAYQVNESHINDILDGANMHAGSLDLYGTHQEDGETVGNGKVVISNVKPIMINQVPTGNYYITWQRCRGQSEYEPSYGRFGESSGNNLEDGIGPEGRKAVAPGLGNQLVFVEVHYRYQPIFLHEDIVTDYSDIYTTAAMIVNDNRTTDLPADNAAKYLECDGDGGGA
jgi:hypothetical protein